MIFVFSGQIFIPQGVITRCYSNGDCSGAVNKELSQLFDNSEEFNINHCCLDGRIAIRRFNLDMLSFTLNGGECRSCDGKFILVYTTTTIMIIIALKYVNN